MEFRPFHYTSRAALEQDIARLDEGFPLAQTTGALRAPLALYGKTLANRLLIQPMEGMDAEPSGAPSARTLARYRAYAAMGAGAVWVESASVNEQGRSGPRQLWLREQTTESFAALVQTMRRAGPVYTVLQLTHSGRSSSPTGAPAPQCAFHNPLIPKDNERIIPDEELAALEEDYLAAARLARQAGFDAVDIRACHGYLINELFAAVHRPGPYGGPFENRVRLLLNIVDKIQKTVPIDLAVRLNVYDGLPWPYGWGVDSTGVENPAEPLALVDLLVRRGVRLLNVSSGVGAFAPYVIRPYDKGGPPPPEHPLRGIERMQHTARLVKQHAPEAVVVASAFTWLRGFGPYAAAGGVGAGWYDLAGFGRQALAYPHFVQQLDHMDPEQCCRTCSGCSALIKQGRALRCVMRPSDGDA